MKALRHIGIVVRDLKKSLHFYRNVLGLKIVREMLETGGYIDRISYLKGVRVKTIKLSAEDGSLIEILYYESHPCRSKDNDIYDPGYSHIAFTVSDVEYEYNRLKEAGVKFNSAPQISPDGKAKVAFCRDPEDNLIELVEELTK